MFRQKEFGDVRLEGHSELVADLTKHGPSLEESNTDEQLLLQAWRLWGEEYVQRIIGDFSFALGDTTKKTLWCVRDFAAARPFYYAHAGRVRAQSVSARWLPQAGMRRARCGSVPHAALSMRGGGIAGAAYLLRLSLSPTDEEWQKGEGTWPLVALGRPPAAFRTDQDAWAGQGH